MGQATEGTNTPTATTAAALTASLFVSFAILLSVIVALVVHYTRPEQKYFIDTVSGSDIEVFPLSEPNVTSTSIIKWVTQAATSAYTLDFYQYQENIDALREYFTIDGYENYVQSLQASNSLNKIIEEKLVVTAVATDTAVILQEGEMAGVYTWRIQVPLLLNYQGASTTGTKKTIAVGLLVTRVPTNEAPKGIGIAQIVDGDYHAEN